MNQKNFMLKLITIPLLAVTALQFTACGDNPIEVEDKKQSHLSIDFDAAIDGIENKREKMDYYECYDKAKRYTFNYKKRCDSFIDKYRSNSTDTVLSLETVIKMVKNEDDYNDKGNYIGTNNDPAINYLLFSKMLKITLVNYKQTKDISESKKNSDPEIRFLVKSYIDNEPSEYDPFSATILDTVNVRQCCSDNKSVAIQIPRGIDAIEICPVLRDKNEHDAYYDDEDLLKESDCVSVKNLGWVKEDEVKMKTTEGEKALIIWEWSLYSIE